MTLALIRHTTVDGAAGRCYGRTELPLAATFADECNDVRRRLGFAPAIVYTSPAARCRQLAEALGAAELRADDRLQELNFGAWENRPWDELPRGEIDAWAADFVERAAGGGESFRELADRVASFRRDCVGQRPTVVVTHAGVIRAWLCLAEGRPLARAFEREVAYGEIVTVAG